MHLSLLLKASVKHGCVSNIGAAQGISDPPGADAEAGREDGE